MQPRACGVGGLPGNQPYSLLRSGFRTFAYASKASGRLQQQQQQQRQQRSLQQPQERRRQQ